MSGRTSYNNYVDYYAATSEAFAIDGYALGNAAPAPAWEPEPEQPEHRPARPARQPARPVKRKKVVYMRVHSNEKFFSFRMVVTLIMIFTGMVMLTTSFAAIRRHQLAISGMQTELMQMQEDEAVLRTKIAEEYDVTQIEKIATTRLNMSKPKAYQIVYINAPKQDYVVQYGTAAEEERQMNVLERVMNYIYGM